MKDGKFSLQLFYFEAGRGKDIFFWRKGNDRLNAAWADIIWEPCGTDRLQ